MSVFAIIGAGMMGSAMSYPLRDNGHEVHIVGTPLDREIVDRLKKDNYHANMKRTLPEGIIYHQIEELEEDRLAYNNKTDEELEKNPIMAWGIRKHLFTPNRLVW